MLRRSPGSGGRGAGLEVGEIFVAEAGRAPGVEVQGRARAGSTAAYFTTPEQMLALPRIR